MEVLGALITKKCEAKLWDPIKVALGGITFLHLFFVDDLVLFVKTNRKNCVTIKDAIETFYVLSGQKVSDKKSRVFFSLNISREACEELCCTLGFRSTPALGKYLGFPSSIPRSLMILVLSLNKSEAGSLVENPICFPL